MKQISDNYLSTEEVFAKNRAKYIESKDFTLDEAPDYIRSTNTRQDRFAHIVDMDTFEAYSTYEHNGDNFVSCYQRIKKDDVEFNKIFISNMQHMFSDEYTDVSVLGKYKINETQTNVISVGTRVKLRTENGGKDYLLLRVIPSASMKSESFVEFIRSYNYADDYNGVNALKARLAGTGSGTLFLNNAPCVYKHTAHYRPPYFSNCLKLSQI